MKKHVSKYFKHPQIQQLLEFPILFLGALPEKIPALYSLMNYADMKGGTWFPNGGMYSVVEAIYKLAMELGVEFHFNKSVIKIEIENHKAKKIIAENKDGTSSCYDTDAVIGNADYHHIENDLLPAACRNYSEEYWNKKTMAPSSILYYVGLNKKLENITHHSLFFDTSFQQHAAEIYELKKWPRQPFILCKYPVGYRCFLAPPGCENLFFLIPVAAGLTDDTEELREFYFDKILSRFETRLPSLLNNILF
jgi:phytoene desaturase